MSEPLRVGLNLAYLVEDSGGAGTYARELIPAMLALEPALELTAWVGASAPPALMHEPWAANVRWVHLPVPGVGSPWHLYYELAAIGLDARRRALDLVHGLAYLAPLVHPGVASVATILDVIWLSHPETAGRRFHLAMRLLAPLVGRTCDRILAISCAARDEVAAGLHLDPRKFDVTPLGITVGDMPAPAGDRALRERLGLGDEPIVLCVAAKRSHKNLHGLIRALAELPEPRPQLVLPGAPNEYERTLRELARELGVEHSVRLPGWVADADLDGLYRAATCFALASFVEGFGLPVLEAMARGVPVVCSDIPVLREVAADAALFFDPSSAASIAQAIARVNLDERMRAQLIERGHARCELFTWERTARATLESYRRALAER